MASGTITFSASGYLQGKIDWSSSSNGSTANTSSVTAKLYARRTNSYTTYGQSWSGYVKVGSTQKNISFSSSVSVSSSWVLMATVTATVSHNDNGTGSATISGSVTGPSGTALSGNTSSGSKTVTLDTIARASVLGTISNFTLSNTINIPITKRSSSFTDTLTISVGGTTIKTISSITDGYDVSFTTSELTTIYGKLSGSKSGTFTFKLTTKSGSTTIGTSSKTATGTIPTGALGTISNFTLGNSVSISISNYHSSLTYNLAISLGGTSIKSVSGIANGDSVSFTSTELTKIYSLLPSATSGTLTFTLTTKSGSTSVGTSTKTATATIPTSVKPTISSVTISEANTSVVPSSWGIYVKNKSKLKFVTSASAGSGSSVSSVKVTVNGSSYTGTTITTNLINTSGSLTATITVTDKRNRSTSTTKTITIVDYGSPYITSLIAIRCDADGTENENGTYAKVSLNAGVYSISGKNTASYLIQYKKTTDTEYQTYTFSNASTTINSYVILSDIDENSSYDIKAVVTDYYSSVSKSIPPLSTAFTTVDYLNGGHGMAIGKVAEEEDLLDIAFKTKFNDDIYDKNGKTIVGGIDVNMTVKGVNFGSTGVIKISNLSGRGAVLVNLIKNGGAEYGLYSIWFNNNAIVKTTLISGYGTPLTASMSDGVLTLTSGAWAIGFYLIYYGG